MCVHISDHTHMQFTNNSNGNSLYLLQCGVYLLIGINEAGFQSPYIAIIYVIMCLC